ncbi:MAG: Ig-like domain-containing protein [Clostridia bacterium]
MNHKKYLSIILIICIVIMTYAQISFARDAQISNENKTSYDNSFHNISDKDVKQKEDTAHTKKAAFIKIDEVPQIIGYEKATSVGHVKRLYEKEDINSAVFKNDDGTESLYSYCYPIKFMDEYGDLQDIKLDIVEDETNAGTFITKQNNIKTVFSRKLTNGFSLSKDNISINVIPLGASEQSVASMQDQQTIVYPYGEKTTLECSLTYTGFKNHFIIEEYTGQTEYSFKLYTNGLKVLQKEQSYYLADEEDNIKVNIGDILVITANEKNNTFADLSCTTLRSNEEYLLTIHLDSEYLADEKVRYPLTIALSSEINYSGSIRDITINSLRGSDGNSGSLYIGRRDTYGISRTLMSFPNLNLSGINYMNVTNAVVNIRDLMCEGTPLDIECRPFMGNAWDESTANWSNVEPNMYGIVMSQKTISYDNGVNRGHWYAFDIQPVVRGWIIGQYSMQRGIMFKAVNAVENGSTNNAKTFGSYNRSEYKPTLYISYTSEVEPSGISISSSSKYAEAGTSFTLTATVYPSNAANKTVTWSSSNASIATVSSSGKVNCIHPGSVNITVRTVNGKTATCTVTVTKETLGLKNGESYYISNVFYDKYLDVVMGYDNNNTEVIGHPFNGQENQKWKLDLCGENLYKLRAGSSSTNKVLHVTNNNIDIYSDTNQSSQKFTIIRQDPYLYAKSGVYYIKYGDKFLTLSAGDTQTLTLTTTADALNGRSLWSFEKNRKSDADLFTHSWQGYSTTFLTNITNNFKDNCTSMGYRSFAFHNISKTNPFSYLKTDSIWVHCGHGSPGSICFTDENGINSFINYSEIDNLSFNQLSNLRCFITVGCSSGLSDSNGNNIIRSIYNKGAQFALGWTNSTVNPFIEWWLQRFFNYSASGKRINECIKAADIFASITGDKYYVGDDYQRLSR